VQGIFITTVLRNESDKAQKTFTKDDFTRFDATGTTADGIRWADAINPAHKCGYAFATLSLTGIEKLADTIELKPKQEVVIARFFAVGTSPAQAVGEVRAAKGDKVTVVSGQVSGEDGKGIATASILVPEGKNTIPGYPDTDGKFSLKLPAGISELQITDLGRPDAKINATAPKAIMKAAAGIRFAITGEDGKPLPCKAHFAPLDEKAPKLDLGPKWRAHGCVDQYHSENGHFTQQLPPGKYHVIVVRGPEYSHIAKDITVEPGKLVEFKGTLKRLVDSKGWISADFHNHSTPSGDNVCDTDGRLINIRSHHRAQPPL
jgi:hypothetical protein